MTKPIFMSHLSLSLFLHIIIATTLVAGDPPPIYTPVEDITVKCGYSGQLFNQYDQRHWSGDINSKFTPLEVHRAAGSNTSMSKEAPGSFSVYQIPYTTVRLSRSEFTYRFNLTAGQKFIRLYFNPVSYPDFDRSEALFSVKAGGFTFLNDFNASVNADANAYEEETLYREFCINIEEEEQSLNITFTPSRSKASPDAYAFINGIEIVSMAPNLYYTAPDDPHHGIELIGTEMRFHVENYMAMETVYRINIGGSAVDVDKDTGLYRYWESFSYEQQYLDDASFKWSVLPINVSVHLNFAKTPNYSAPEQVYQTGRSMGPDPTINQRYNLTWGFPVPPKFYYLVRLHFCEFEPLISKIGDRVFQIYIANQTAETRADIIDWSGGNEIPTYRDYVVFMPSVTGNEKKVFLSITLQPHPMHWRISRSVDAILNGLEIFKLSEANGNLAGPDPDPPPQKSSSKTIYTPVEDITVKCGYSGQLFNQYDQRHWSGDINSKFTPLEVHRAAGSNTSMSKEAPGSFSVYQIPYTTVRLSRSEFTYRFNLTAGQKFIRLYFYPVSYPDFDRSEALFSVKASGFTLLKDFNASVNADADGVETLYKEFCINIGEEEQSLNITFTPTPSNSSPDAYAFINGIEIVSMPPNLYYTAPEDLDIEIIGTENPIRVENNTAMEAVYRINIGGGPLFFNKDTGLYRNWEGYSYEQHYLDNASLNWSVLPINTSVQLDFHLHFAKTPNYSAPEQVYKTGRSMGPDATINQRYNLTWGFPVPPKFYYLVRLHFCEFEPQIREIGDRVFLIYIANQTAETRADIIQWSGGNGIPTYRDYVVLMPSGTGNEEKVFLYVTLQANPQHWKTNYLDAILNGLEIFKLNATSGNLARPDPDPPYPHPQEVIPSSKNLSKSRTHFIAVVAGAVSAALVVFSVLGLLLVFRHRRKYVKGYVHSSRRAANSTKSRGGSTLPSDLCHYFSLKEIKAATENFNDTFIIGVGGFGNVYKGYIDGGATPVAIKRLKPESSQGANEFKTEIELLSQLRHRHLVSLIGYCTDKNEMVLVYDYMSRGTLADNLYHSDNPPLAWGQRLQICIGAAQGLRYLHSGAKGTIIHRDVKSTNILLDEKWVAKVSDFGLSKMGMTTASKTHISTMVKGSFGYLDPEYYRRQHLTEKSDVYSFGVVLWEVLCARPALMHKVEPKEMNLAEWAKFCHGEGTLDQIIDCNLKGKVEAECLNMFIEIAMSCIHDKGVERPSMNEVVKGLEFALQLHQKNIGSNGDSGVSTEQGCASNESIQCISATIFSEINDQNGR